MDKIVNFSIPHISEHIFELLDDPTLVQCRSVSKTWKVQSDKIVLKRWKDNLLMVFSDGHVDVVQVLLDHLDLNAKGQFGFTPLIAACKNGQIEVVKILLENSQSKSIKLDIDDNSGKTAFMWACRSGKQEVVKLLLESKNVDFNAKDNYGETGFMMACQFGHKDVVKLLLDTQVPNSIDLNAKDMYGQTGLAKACLSEQLNVVQSLLLSSKSKGINVPSKLECLWFSRTINQILSIWFSESVFRI